MSMIGKFITPALLPTAGAVAGKVAFSGVGLLLGASGARTVIRGIRKGAQATGVLYGSQAHGYGKRGMDSGNLNTEGLVQGLHNKRRTMR